MEATGADAEEDEEGEDDDDYISKDNLEGFSFPALKALCKQHGLTTKGRKAELVERLHEVYEKAAKEKAEKKEAAAKALHHANLGGQPSICLETQLMHKMGYKTARPVPSRHMCHSVLALCLSKMCHRTTKTCTGSTPYDKTMPKMEHWFANITVSCLVPARVQAAVESLWVLHNRVVNIGRRICTVFEHRPAYHPMCFRGCAH